MKSRIAIAIVLSVCLFSRADWRLDFDEEFAQLFGATGTPIPAVAWYKLDGNALDSSGNGYNGTWGGTEVYAAGKFAGTQAASFNAESWIDTGISNQVASGLMATSSTRFSVSWWGSASTGISGAYIARAGATTTGRTFQCFSVTTINPFDFWVCGSLTSVSGTVVGAGYVHHAVTWDGTTMRVYRNGSYVASLNVGTATEELAQRIIIGARTNGTATWFLGQIQDVRIFNRALSEANIARIMTGPDVVPIEEQQ